MERESDESVVDGRLVDLDEKMEGVDLSVDDERLEREVDRIDERSRTRHDVLILCCIVDYCCVFAPESTMADYGAWSGCNGLLQGIISKCLRTAELFLGGAISARTNDGS